MTESVPQLGKYQILGELGKGGFATVYRALDVTLEREVALKILHPQLLFDNHFVQQFHHEARTIAKLNHPHIVTIFEAGEVEGRLVIAMELVRGPSLAQFIAQAGRISWAWTLSLLRLVCEALEYAHNQGVVHRDLKPANVLINEGGHPLVTDFGFARVLGQSSVSLSMSGGIIGTPSYIAPEVWEQNVSGMLADIYALGCIASEMLSGQVLFTGATVMQVMRAHDRGPRFPQNWPEDAPAGIEGVLSKAVAKEPSERYRSTMAFWYALKGLESEAMKQREEEQQEALVAQWRAEVEAAVAAQEWTVARMALRRWMALSPGDPAALVMQQEIARLSEPKKESLDSPVSQPEARDAQSKPEEVHRQQGLAELHDEARRLHQDQQWQAVVETFERIHALDPAYPDPEGLMKSAQDELSAIERERRLDALYVQAVYLIRQREWTQVLERLEDLQRRQPHYRDTEALIASVRQELDAEARAAREREEQAKQQRVAEAERQQKLASLYSEARRLHEQERWQEVVKVFEQIRTLDATYPDPEGLLRSATAGQVATKFVVGVVTGTLVLVLMFLWSRGSVPGGDSSGTAQSGTRTANAGITAKVTGTPTRSVSPTRPPRTPTALPASATEAPSFVPSTTSTVPRPTATATSVPGLVVGGTAWVSNTDNLGLRVRAGPGLNFETLLILVEGSRVTILDGPRDADEVSWWQIEVESGTRGWTMADFLTPVRPGDLGLFQSRRVAR